MITMECPNRETLFAYTVGHLSGERSEELSAHLESCSDCQREMVTLEDSGDTLVGRLRASHNDSYLDEPQFEDAVAKAVALPGDDSAQGADEKTPSGSTAPVQLGEYQLLEELGHGGMGRVYKALHTNLDRVVALKILPRGRLESSQAIARFEREMRAIGRLDHPHVVHAYDARQIDGVPVLIMEYVDGADLAELVRRLGPLPVEQACELIRQAALGLQGAHEHGLVHRDIKPSNIMLARNGEAKLLDLGLARFYTEPIGEEMTGTGQMMGTADYVAPEQATDSRSADVRADIYSLGCALYKLLAGQAPYSGSKYPGTLEKMNAHVREPIPPIEQLVPDLPDPLPAVLDRMLAKRPEDRYDTPGEVAEALAPFCEGADVGPLVEEAIEADQLPCETRRELESPPGPHVQPAQPMVQGKRWKLWQWLTAIGLMLLAMAACFAAGVVITIHRAGKTTQVEVPDGSSATVGPEGDVDVKLPADAARREETAADPYSDTKRIQGRWELVSLNQFGEKAPEHVLANLEWVFDGPYLKWVTHDAGTVKAFEWGLDPPDPSAPGSPRGIELLEGGEIVLVGEIVLTGGEIKYVGIYRFRDDRLQIALSKAPLRPKDFTPGPNKIVAVLKRSGRKEQTDREALQGVWKLRSAEDSGNRAPQDEIVDFRLVFDDEEFWFGTNERTEMEGTYELDPSADPKEITFFNDPPAGKLNRGIYRLEKDRLRIVLNEQPELGRPTRFVSEADSPNDLLFEFERADGAGKPRAAGRDLPRIEQSRADAYAEVVAASDANRLKRIGLAMHKYRDARGSFPPAVLLGPDGETPYSWRVALLPFLGQALLYEQYRRDEPWDSPHNRELLDQMPEVYRAAQDTQDASVFALVGPGTVFPGDREASAIQDISDGTSNTILLVKAKRDMPWTKPEDIEYHRQQPLPELGGFFENGFHAVLADGSVHFLPEDLDEQTLRALITRDGRERVREIPRVKPRTAAGIEDRDPAATDDTGVTLVVSIGADGALRVDGQERSLEWLRKTLQVRSQKITLTVQLAVDPDVPYRRVAEVVDALEEAGADEWKLSLNARPPTAEPPVDDVPDVPEEADQPQPAEPEEQ